MLGLYVHIPYCLRKCYYCNFTTVANAPLSERQRYFEALECQIAHVRSRYGELFFDTLYLGGGTPSFLQADEMACLLGFIRSAFAFREGCEATCEVNPGDTSDEKLQLFRRHGINRISLGAQSFSDALLSQVGRIHDRRAIYETLDRLAKHGFVNVSLDLMLRLPGQKVQDVKDSIQAAVDLNVKQVVLYDLNVHRETVFGQRQLRGQLHLPSEELHEEMFQAAQERLIAAGFRQYEVTSFAKPGFESQHNLIYWHNQDYLGLGPGAFSYLGGKRTQFALTVSRYIDKCSRGDWSNDEEDEPSPQEREIETVLTGLRLQEGVEVMKFSLIRNHLQKEILFLESQDLLYEEAGRVFLTRRGRFLAETVFTHLSLIR